MNSKLPRFIWLIPNLEEKKKKRKKEKASFTK